MILDVITDNPILAVIVAGEVGFWLLIGAGLVVDRPAELTAVLIIWLVGWPLWASLAPAVRNGRSG